MDNKEIKEIKNAVKNYLETKFHLHESTFRKLRMLTIEEKTLVHDKITKLISEIPNQKTIDQPGSAACTISANEEVQYCLRMYSVWCTRYGLLAISTTSGSLLSGEGESEMERERARATESERGRYETDDALMFCLAPSFGHRDTPSFACATGVRDGRKQLR